MPKKITDEEKKLAIKLYPIVVKIRQRIKQNKPLTDFIAHQEVIDAVVANKGKATEQIIGEIVGIGTSTVKRLTAKLPRHCSTPDADIVYSDERYLMLVRLILESESANISSHSEYINLTGQSLKVAYSTSSLAIALEPDGSITVFDHITNNKLQTLTKESPMRLEQLLEKYESVDGNNTRYKDLLEKLIVSSHESQTKIQAIEQEIERDKLKYEEAKCKRQHELVMQQEQLEAQRERVMTAKDNADTRLKSTEIVATRTESKSKAELERSSQKSQEQIIKDVKKSVIKVETKIKGTVSASRVAAKYAEIACKYKGYTELENEYNEAFALAKQYHEERANTSPSLLNNIQKNTCIETALFYLNEIILPTHPSWDGKPATSFNVLEELELS